MTHASKASTPDLRETLGPVICAWMEEWLVHSEGDYLGQRFTLHSFQKSLIYEMYEVDKTGRRVYDRVLLGLPKGNGKSELAAAIAVTELAGPVLCDGFDAAGHPIATERVSPNIPVAASSYDQAALVFGAASKMITEGPLQPYFDVFERAIQAKEGSGKMYRVAAVAGANDGLKPTFCAFDEIHEWTGPKERVHLVLSNGRAKRRNTWELNITTAGWDQTSLLWRLYEHGREVLDGSAVDPRYLFRWFQPSREWDLADPEQLRQAIIETNPATDPDMCGGEPFLDVENIIARYTQIPEFEWRRYHLNEWTTVPEFWFPPGMWEALNTERTVPDDEPIVVGFDGSYSGDSTALVGCTISDPHLFVLGHWENPGKDSGWRVNIMDVENRIRQVCAERNVTAVGCDPFRWQRTMAMLEEEGMPIIEWPSHLPSRMVPGCAQFYDAVQDGTLSHDEDDDLARHIKNCIIKEDSRGPRITKQKGRSLLKIDLAVAAVIAFDLAYRHGPPPKSRYEDDDATLGAA